MNILIVDDHETNRKLLRVTLEAEGFSTLEAADGLEALALLERQPVDAIISDILMPRMDGFRLCQEIRRHDRFSYLPFLIYSATYTSAGDAKLALDSGADRYLRKPCPVPTMVAAIQEVAAAAQQRHSRPATPAQEAQVMRQYNEALVRKLEERNAEIEQQREWLRVTLNSIGDAVIATDLAGCIAFLNPVAQALTGWGETEALGQPIQTVFRIINEQTRAPAEDITQRVLHEGAAVLRANHTALLTRAGRQIPIEDSAAPIKNSAGQVCGVVLVFRDVTAQRQAQQALEAAQAKLQAHAEELEKTVARRTARLQETVGELEHFSYAIVHDMRAPLRAMQGFAEMIEEECSGCQRTVSKEYFRRVKIGARRMDQLITDCLNYSKTVIQEFPLEPVDLAQLLNGLVETYPNLLPDKADIQIAATLPTVLGNEAALTQCFSNLLGNAVKFAKPGTKPQIRVWAEEGRIGGLMDKRIDESAGASPQSSTNPPIHSSTNPPIQPSAPRVRVWVEDDGIGIPEGFQHRVFGMFQRCSKAYEGTGMGLAIVCKVAQRMGGDVGFESQEGKGSRFWVELRRA